MFRGKALTQQAQERRRGDGCPASHKVGTGYAGTGIRLFRENPVKSGCGATPRLARGTAGRGGIQVGPQLVPRDAYRFFGF